MKTKNYIRWTLSLTVLVMSLSAITNQTTATVASESLNEMGGAKWKSIANINHNSSRSNR